MPAGVNVIAMSKDGHRYVFLFDDKSEEQLLATMGRYAADEDLNFSWYDAAMLSRKVAAMMSVSPRKAG